MVFNTTIAVFIPVVFSPYTELFLFRIYICGDLDCSVAHGGMLSSLSLMAHEADFLVIIIAGKWLNMLSF
jgi:hypothetical protein